MLKKLHPLLGPELLYILSRMGHGDRIAVVDANFPAESNAKRLVRLDGVTATNALEAIVSVLPIDTYVDDPVNTMAVVAEPDAALRLCASLERSSPAIRPRQRRLSRWNGTPSTRAHARPSLSSPPASAGSTETSS